MSTGAPRPGHDADGPASGTGPAGDPGPHGTDPGAEVDPEPTTEPTPGSDNDGAEAGYVPPSGSDDPASD